MGELKIACAQLGPIDTNTYILMDEEIKEAVIIDPAGSPEELIRYLPETWNAIVDSEVDGKNSVPYQLDKSNLRYGQKMIEQKEQIDALRQERKMTALSKFLDKLYEQAEQEVLEEKGLFFPENVIRAYRYNGGAPWLDGDYTVFGEVTDGMKVVSKIEKAKTDAKDEPIEEIRILKAVIEE